MTRVLVADDEEDVLESTQILLEMEGHDVRVVRRAAGILSELRRDPPDVLLQDVHMPGLHLGELLAAIRADEQMRGVAIVLFTAAPDAAALVERWGVEDVIRKPFEADELEATLKRWAGRRRA